jgi:hypothetical protein
MVYPTHSNLSAKTRALVDHLVDWFAQPRALQGSSAA